MPLNINTAPVSRPQTAVGLCLTSIFAAAKSFGRRGRDGGLLAKLAPGQVRVERVTSEAAVICAITVSGEAIGEEERVKTSARPLPPSSTSRSPLRSVPPFRLPLDL